MLKCSNWQKVEEENVLDLSLGAIVVAPFRTVAVETSKRLLAKLVLTQQPRPRGKQKSAVPQRKRTNDGKKNSLRKRRKQKSVQRKRLNVSALRTSAVGQKKRSVRQRLRKRLRILCLA